ESSLERGRALYHTGQSANGVLSATVQQDVTLPPSGAACVSCHRRSGLGTSEGAVRSLPVTASALFQATTTGLPRPAYDAATLRRAISEGIASDGRSLSAVMPRYRLSDADADALWAYLHELGVGTPPGVSPDEIELATVVASDVPPDSR